MAEVKFPFDHFETESPEWFRINAGNAGINVPVSDDLSVLGKGFSVDSRMIANSMAIQPLEGLDAEADGSPGSLTFARYEKLAAQGAGILWIEATAFSEDGRGSGRQLWINDESLPKFAELARHIDDAAHAAGKKKPYKIIQLTHSGRCSRGADGRPRPLAAFESPYLDNLMGKAEIVTDDYIDNMKAQFEKAAVLSYEAGFDAVDLKLCHQYLMKELLCAYKRPGKYGGSAENRFSFALDVVDRVRSRLGSALGIAVRLNAYDGIPWPYGWGMKQQEGTFETDLTEVLDLIGRLYRKGVKIFNITTTSPRFSPDGNGYLDNFNNDALVDPFKGEACLLEATRQIRLNTPKDMKIIATGLSWFGPFSAYVGAGGIKDGWFDIAGFGRSVMTNNDFIPSILEGREPDRSKACRGCDSCFKLFYADLPTGCPVYHKAWGELFAAASENGLADNGVIY